MPVQSAHCPALPAYRRCIRQSRKLHLAGEFIAQPHTEESRVTLVGAGEVEIDVYEVVPHLFGLQRMRTFLKLEVASHGQPSTIFDLRQFHGGVLQLA